MTTSALCRKKHRAFLRVMMKTILRRPVGFTYMAPSQTKLRPLDLPKRNGIWDTISIAVNAIPSVELQAGQPKVKVFQVFADSGNNVSGVREVGP